MQGPRHAERALKHYDRALELKPDLAVAYMYRGVLLTQMSDLRRASADHERLLKLDRNLAAQLEAVIVRRVTGDDRAGIAPQYD
jgi:tetratricopeptide (TPR) repeat protein